jgi:hypothetical protein
MYGGLAIRALGACIAVLALGAPAASAETATNALDSCSGTARWERLGTKAEPTMRLTLTTACHERRVTADGDAGTVTPEESDATATSTYEAPLECLYISPPVSHGSCVWGASSWTSPNLALDSTGSGVVSWTGDKLTATLTGTSPTGVGLAVGHYQPVGGCGVKCWDTTVTWTSNIGEAG